MPKRLVARLLVMITGSKGGSGKTFVSRYLADRYYRNGISVTLVDADADVEQLRQYYRNSKIVPANEPASIIGIVEAAQTPVVLMDMPGRGLSDLRSANHEASMFQWFSDSGVAVVMINVITPYRASIHSVKTMLDVIGDGNVQKFVLLNEKFGPRPDDWILWYGSKALDIPESSSRRRLLNESGKELRIPEVRTAVPVLLDIDSESFSDAISSDKSRLKTADLKQYLRTWLRGMDNALRPIDVELGL